MPLNNFGVVALRNVSNPRPTYLMRAEQPNRESFTTLSSLLAYEGIVSYRLSGSDEGPVSYADETNIVTARKGRVVLDTRLHNGMKPDVSMLKIIATDVNNILAGGESVLVHCLHGRERTGGVIAAWSLMFGGWPLVTVEADLARYGMHGLTALFDHEILEAVRALAKERGL